MKEATGELNMTVVTLIAVAALGAVFYLVIWPMVQRMLVQQTCNTYGEDWNAIKITNNEGTNSGMNDSNATVFEWMCCPGEANTIAGGCVGVD